MAGVESDKDVSRRVQAAYDRVVDAYAEKNHTNTADALSEAIELLVERVGVNSKILDLGCGTGRDMARFEALDGWTIGGDLSGGMLTFAQNEVVGPLVMMDMRTVPFADASFDGVWSCASLLHIPKAEAPDVLNEVWRVLMPKGVLILMIQEGDDERWDGGYVEGVERFFARYQTAEMESMLVQAGFDVESVAKEVAGQKIWLRFICMKI